MPLQRISNTDIQTATTFVFSNTLFGLGSAGAPSLAFSGDTNTGIFSPGADTIAFAEGGVESMRIDSSGRVGIGTSSPQGKLDIVSGADQRLIISTNSSNTAITSVKADNSNYQALRVSGMDLLFATGAGDTERMRITSTGNVGIGRTPESPIRLDVENSADVYAAFRKTNGVALLLYGGTNEGWLYTATNHPLVFGTNNTEKMRITAAGRVGIGTSSPGERLDVSGGNIFLQNTNAFFNIRANSGSSGFIQFTESDVADRWSIGTANGNDSFIFKTGGGFTGTERMRITGDGILLVGRTSTPSVAGARIALNSTLDTALQITKEGVVAGRVMAVTTGLAFGVDGADGATERMRITSGGDVGIGTSSPGAKLDINGVTNCRNSLTLNDNYIYFTLGGEYIRGVSASGAMDYYSRGPTTITYNGNNISQPLVFKNVSTEVMRIDSAGRVTMPYQPAFYANGFQSATLTSGVVRFGSNSIPINVGGHYSQSTGRFTAPIAGTYMFCTVGMAQNQWFRAELRKNGSRYAEYRTTDSVSNSNYPQSSLTVLVPLAANDYVDINITGGIFGGGWEEVQFGGYLVG